MDRSTMQLNKQTIEDEDMEAAKALVLQEGTDINAVNSDGSTPLFLVRVNNNTS